MAQLAYKEALDLAIFAFNTLMHPEGSAEEDYDRLVEKADDVLETLVDIRTTVEELPAPPSTSTSGPDDETLRLSFSPAAIRDHFEGEDPDPTEGLTDEQLREVGWAALTDDFIYAEFHRSLGAALADLK